MSKPSGLIIFNNSTLIPNKKIRKALWNMNKNSLALTNILIKETGLNYKPHKLKNKKQDFISGIEMTQNINSKFNHDVADKIYKKQRKGMKENLILDCAKEFSHQKSFLNGAINSQLGASNWDFLFKLLLRLFR